MVPGARHRIFHFSIAWKRILFLVLLFLLYQVYQIPNSQTEISRIDLERNEDGSRSGSMYRGVTQFFVSLVSTESSMNMILMDQFDKVIIDPGAYAYYHSNQSFLLSKRMDKGCYRMLINYPTFNTSFSCLLCGPWTVIHGGVQPTPSYIAYIFAFVFILFVLVIQFFVTCLIFNCLFVRITE